jgi:hypothetical protein
MAVKTTRTTDPQTGELSSITVEWDEGLHRRGSETYAKLGLMFGIPFLLAVSEPLPPNGSSTGNWLIFWVALLFMTILIVPFLKVPQAGFFPKRPVRKLVIHSDGTLSANGGDYSYDGGASTSNTRLEDIKDILIDEGNNWIRKSEIFNDPQAPSISWLVIILQRTDGQSVFLSQCNYPRGVLQPILVALTNAIEEMKKYIKTDFVTVTPL